jgi:hypothetical protein
MIDEALQKYGEYRYLRPIKIQLLITNLDNLLYHYIQLKNRPKTTPTVTRNIGLWFNNRNNPIHADEAGFLSQQDLISVARFEKPPLRTIFEQRVLLPLAKRWNRHQPRDETLLSENTTAIVAPEPIDTIIAFFIFLVATPMLVVLLWALAIVTGMFRKLGIITICLFLFLGVLNWGTLSRPFEILAATAGYVVCSLYKTFIRKVVNSLIWNLCQVLSCSCCLSTVGTVRGGQLGWGLSSLG